MSYYIFPLPGNLGVFSVNARPATDRKRSMQKQDQNHTLSYTVRVQSARRSRALLILSLFPPVYEQFLITLRVVTTVVKGDRQNMK